MKLRYPKLHENIPRSVEQKYIQLILGLPEKTWQELRFKALISLLYSTGMRINEALGLLWNDITGKYAKVLGKGNKVRYVPILEQTAAILAKYKESMPYNKAKNDFIFISNFNKKWHACSVAREFRKIVILHDLPKITPHSLRHACATHLLQSGCNLRNIQTLLGHKTLETTKAYIQYSNKELKNTYLKATE